jgi:signal transduction histidine kinase
MRGIPAVRRRSRREWLSLALVFVGLVGFVGVTYLLVVVGGGLLVGHADTPHVGLSVLATALVALGFDRVLTRLEAFAARVAQRGQPSPYDVMRRFSGVVSGARPDEDLPLRMARLLAEGTGAEWAQVWVAVGGQPVPAATWPPEAMARLVRSPEWDPGTRRLPVRHGEEDLGMLVLRERPGAPLTPVEERLFAGLAAQAGLVLRGARLRAELEQRLAELSAREAELRESRERLVDAHDETRRALERDIHDGAQQHLVALAVNLRLAASLRATAPQRATALLAAQEGASEETVATLVRLSRGIYPPLLEEAGVATALRAAAGDGSFVVAAVGTARHPIDVEAAAYFCGLEAVQNASKHAAATAVRVDVDAGPDGVTLTVSDDGKGFDPTEVKDGAGLANIRDRVDSFGGTLRLTTAAGQGTRLRVVIPSHELVAADVTAEGRG